MKIYFCLLGHEFDDDQVLEYIREKAICPFCWPNGYLKDDQTPIALPRRWEGQEEAKLSLPLQEYNLDD